MVASEHSSGERIRRGGITKTGNAHLRRIVIEAAWAYRHRPVVGWSLRKRQEAVSEEVKEIAWKAQHRLYGRYRKLSGRGKRTQTVVTAMAREGARIQLAALSAAGKALTGWARAADQLTHTVGDELLRRIDCETASRELIVGVSAAATVHLHDLAALPCAVANHFDARQTRAPIDAQGGIE